MRLTTRLCAALMLLASIAGLTACGESSDQRAARGTVTRFYEALKRSDARTACRLLDPAVAKTVSGEGGKPCVAAFQQLFRRVASSSEAQFFATPPRVGAAVVDGDSAIVTVRRGGLRRRVSLRRAGERWRITGSPDSLVG